MSRIELGDLVIDVERKEIKNVHLSVYPPNGRVKISAPSRMSLDVIRVYALSRLQWIRAQQRSLRAQEREAPREYLERESHYVWGKRLLLRVVDADATPRVEPRPNRLVVSARAGTSASKIGEILERWYRRQLREAAAPIVAKWEPLIEVALARVFVQRMKTRWGSCNASRRTIRLNADLAKKPRECLEYIIVHEMIHLIEPTHNDRFVALMNRHLPKWRHFRDELNRLPLRHVEWRY